MRNRYMTRPEVGTSILEDAIQMAIDQAAKAGRELATVEQLPPEMDDRVALCMIRAYKNKSALGVPLAPATERVCGDIVLGPYASSSEKPSMETLKRKLWGQRWVYSRMMLGDGQSAHPSAIRSTPNLRIIPRLEIECASCGKKARVFKDLLMRFAKTRDGGKAFRYSQDLLFECPWCHSKELTVKALHNTANQDRPGRNDDPVVITDPNLGFLAENTLEELLAAWEKGPAKRTSVTLPRVWAVYPQGVCPDQEWTPDQHDVRAKLLLKFCREQNTEQVEGQAIKVPLDLLPFKEAAQYHRGPEPLVKAKVGFYLEVEKCSVGWVRLGDLYASRETLGFNRMLWRFPTRSAVEGTPATNQEQVAEDALEQAVQES